MATPSDVPKRKKKIKGKTTETAPKTRQLLLDPSAWKDEGTSLSTQLAGLEDDIVVSDPSNPHPLPPLSTIRTFQPQRPPSSAHPPPPSLPTSSTATTKPPEIPPPALPHLYVEGKRRFVAKSPAERLVEEKKRAAEALRAGNGDGSGSNASGSPRSDPDSPRSIGLIQIAIAFQRFFLRFAHFCHGILAGFSLWQCVVLIFFYEISERGGGGRERGDVSLTAEEAATDIDATYSDGGLDFVFGLQSWLCKPTNCAFVLLSTLTLVAALDDADIASSSSSSRSAPSWLCSRFASITAVLRALVLPFLLLGFVVNNVLMQKDCLIRF